MRHLFFYSLLFISISLSSNLSANAQQQNKVSSTKAFGAVQGKVIDADNSQPIQYVNIALLKTKDSTLVNGSISNDKGIFTLKESYGKYLIRITFIGYQTYITPLEIKTNNINLGEIKLKQSSSTLQGVEITAEKSMVEYQLDKRVINVDKNLVSAGGSATDVLENVPSVSVDESGNVSLRGSSNVKVLVDGKPSELLGSDLQSILEQIPASTIENIEVITNPSAKYNPEGMSGIINIVLKEKGNRGLNGNIAMSGGFGSTKIPNNSSTIIPTGSISAGINYSTKKYALFVNGDLRYGKSGSFGNTDKFTFINQDTTNIFQERFSLSNRLGGGFKIGGDWYIDNKTTLTLGYNLRRGGSLGKTPNKEELFNIDRNDHLNINNRNNYYGLEESIREMLFHTFSLNFEKKFNKKDQVLSLDANWNMGSSTGEDIQTRRFDINSPENYYLMTNNTSNNKRAVISLNYTHPFSESFKLETGYNFNYTNNSSNYDYFSQRDNTSRDDSMSYNFIYKEQIHALYATLGYSFGKKLSAQLGLRAEEVIRDGNKSQQGIDYPFPRDKETKNYFSLFPTLHVSYNITESQSAQISYSKRINRPSPWNMAPFIDINNPENIRFGNPDLMPEYTNAFEIGYNKIFRTTSIFASIYYRQTNDAITWYNFLWNRENAIANGFEWVWDVVGDGYDNRIAMTTKNLSKSTNYGAEIIIDQQLAKWWKINLSGNIFGNYADGREFGGQLVNTLNWDAKINSTMNLPKNWIIQLSAQYQPKRINIQGYSTQMFWTDLAVKKDILNKKGSLSLRVSDIFNTRKRTTYTFSDNFTQYSVRQRTSQMIILSFNYRFGVTDREQMQRQRKRQQSENGSMEMIGIDE